jgi:hypothetical protein
MTHTPTSSAERLALGRAVRLRHLTVPEASLDRIEKERRAAHVFENFIALLAASELTRVGARRSLPYLRSLGVHLSQFNAATLRTAARVIIANSGCWPDVGTAKRACLDEIERQTRVARFGEGAASRGPARAEGGRTYTRTKNSEVAA